MTARDFLYVPGQPIPGYSNDRPNAVDLERQVLVHAIVATGRAAGVYDDQKPLTGPDVLRLLADISEASNPRESRPAWHAQADRAVSFAALWSGKAFWLVMMAWGFEYELPVGPPMWRIVLFLGLAFGALVTLHQCAPWRKREKAPSRPSLRS